MIHSTTILTIVLMAFATYATRAQQGRMISQFMNEADRLWKMFGH